MLFQSTPSWRGRPKSHTLFVFIEYFNPRPREEGDIVVSGARQRYFYFNPRPREEGDPVRIASGTPKLHFNPRPREEGDSNKQSNNSNTNISIHALVKRATVPVCKLYDSFVFQSTPSWRGRHENNTSQVVKEVISIHALVKRATMLTVSM